MTPPRETPQTMDQTERSNQLLVRFVPTFAGAMVGAGVVSRNEPGSLTSFLGYGLVLLCVAWFVVSTLLLKKQNDSQAPGVHPRSET